MDGEREAQRVRAVRAATEEICDGLDAEDCLVQSMPDASPLKWHLAHTTWFFTTFVLGPDAHAPPPWASLFNSYYVSAGTPHPRARRGDLARPYLREVLAWRREVDDALVRHLAALPAAALELGLQHEQQHQELMRMDVKHHLAAHPLRPAYRACPPAAPSRETPLGWVSFDGGLVEIGAPPDGFAFDHERPRHRVWLAPFAIADRLVTNGEWRAFRDDGGYRQPRLWLSDGWAWRVQERVEAPLYWSPDGASLYTLAGERALDPHEPVVHVGHYEADAFARWAGARLPTEEEWEHACAGAVEGGPAAQGHLHPAAAPRGAGVRQAAGEVWQWTSSAFGPYPGYRPFEGAFGEYNGKFMCNQLVLRGGACVTPPSHVRLAYRNFYYPKDRWPFTGVRLARGR